MKAGTMQKRLVRSCCAVLALLCLGMAVSSADAQLLYSFEPDLQGWGPTMFGGSDLINVTHSTIGPTDGTHSMAVKRGKALPDPPNPPNAFSWDVNRTVTPAVLPDIYASFQAAAADPTKYALDFDLTLDPAGFATVSAPGPFLLISASTNGSVSGENNFDQVLNLVPASGGENLITVVNMVDTPRYGTHYFSVPLATSLSGSDQGLYLPPDSTYYQLNIGSNLQNALFTPAVVGEGMVYYVDNVRFRRLPDLIPETIFSWETPDNPGTPAVNEQLEGWEEGFQPGHTHSITTTGATDGSSALQIHRVFTGSNFQWGSRLVLFSDINPDPEIEEIDPVIQAKIDELTTKIEAADRIAFDVTFDPTVFDGSPTFTRFGMFIQDTAGFYDAEFANFNILSFTEETTLSMELPISAFATAANVSLADVGFADDLNFFQMGISTNLDGLQVGNPPLDTPIDFQIDNLRLITEVFPLEGDYNADGAVDAADYVVWRKNVGTTNTLPNDPDGGTIGPLQYATWRANFGAGTGGGASLGGGATAPEPGSALLVILAAFGGLFVGRRGV